MPDNVTLEASSKPGAVTASLNYVGRTAGKTIYCVHDHARSVMELEPTTIAVENGRLLADPPRFDREGFEHRLHETAVCDFSDRDAIEGVYAEEVKALVQQVSGADEVVVLADHAVVRFGERHGKKLGDETKPARFAHLDFTVASTMTTAAAHNPRPGKSFKRCAAINVWRALSSPPQDTPLAVCDSRTIGRTDLSETDAIVQLGGQDEMALPALALVVHANPAHRWVYYPDLTRNEALIFKSCDTDIPEAAETRSSPHCAFDDPSAPTDAEPRSSVEMRAIAYWY